MIQKRMEKVLFISDRFLISFIDCLEEKVQGKIRRVNLTRTIESGWIGPVTTEPGKSASPPRTNPPENQIESQKFNSPTNNVSSQTSKTNSPYIALETDMDVRLSSTVESHSFISVSNRKNFVATI